MDPDGTGRAPAISAPALGPGMTRSQLEKILSQFHVETDKEGEPVLLRRDGSSVDTWREGYPYAERMTRREYDVVKRSLQIELLKLQGWVKSNGEKMVILFEGRDAAGKGGTIKRFIEHLNPRGARTVALDRPSDRESTQWYFQRYIAHLPAARPGPDAVRRQGRGAGRHPGSPGRRACAGGLRERGGPRPAVPSPVVRGRAIRWPHPAGRFP